MAKAEQETPFSIFLQFPESMSSFAKKYLEADVDVKNMTEAANREFLIIVQNHRRLGASEYELKPDVERDFLQLAEKYRSLYLVESKATDEKNDHPELRKLIKDLGFIGETPDKLISSLAYAERIKKFASENVSKESFNPVEVKAGDEGKTINLLKEAEKIQILFSTVFSSISGLKEDGFAPTDPVALMENKDKFNSEFNNFINTLVLKLKEIVISRSQKQAAKQVDLEFKQELTDSGKDSATFIVLDLENLIGLPTSLVVAEEKKVSTQKKEVVRQLEAASSSESVPDKKIKIKIKILENSNLILNGILEKNIEKFERIQEKRSDNSESITNEDSSKEALLNAKINKLKKLLSTANILLEELFVEKSSLDKGNEVSFSREKDLEIVLAIYERLKSNNVPHNKEYALPEFEALFDMDSKAAYDLLTIAIMKRIEEFYIVALAGGSTSFAFHTDSIDMWANDDMFNIALEGSEDNTSFKFFIENFPWSRLLPEDKRTGDNIIDLKKKIVSSWMFRIIAIQNASNAASGVENLWRGQEHGSYHEEIFQHVSNRGAGGGGNQGWDLGPYYTRTHRGSDNGSALMREVVGEEEKGWMMPEYENYFLHAIQQKYNTLHLNDLDKVSALKHDLEYSNDPIPPEKPTILNILYKQIKTTPGGEERLKKDFEMIGIAALKAVWTIVHTLKLHEWDKGGIHSRLGRYNVKAYFGKVFHQGVSGVQWRPELAASVNQAILPFETVTTLKILLQDGDGNDIYDDSRLDYENTNSVYRRWLLDLKIKALDKYTNISSLEDVEWLKKEQSRLRRISFNNGELAQKKLEAGALKKKIVNWDNYNVDGGHMDGRHVKKKSQELRDKDIEVLSKMQRAIDANSDLNYISRLLEAIGVALDRNDALPLPERGEGGKVANRAATTFAIESRYKVIKIKKEYTGLGLDARLPIAIPKQRLKTEEGILVAEEIPIQAVRDSQIQTSDYVDWGAISKNPNTSWVAFSLELKRWFQMLDLQDHDAIFTSVHAHRLQEKIIPMVSAFEDFDDIKYKLIKAKLGFTQLVRNSPEAVSKIGEGLDVFFRKEVLISDIPLSELVSESEDDGQKPAGFGFTKITQYAAKYLFGKTPNKMLFLEMFRDKVSNLDEIIAAQATNPSGDAKKQFSKAITTPVPPWLRDVVDESLDKGLEKDYPKRSENEVIIGLFWLAIDAYLDQYAYNEHVGMNLEVPISRRARLGLMSAVETVSGAKPMNFADRQLFITYVDKMLEYFKSSSFSIGDDSPRNIGSSADVVGMMKKKRIIGSSMQLLTDLDFRETGYKALIKTEESKKESH